MLTMAFLVVITADQNEHTPAPGLIPLALNAFRRLFDALVLGTPATADDIVDLAGIGPEAIAHWRQIGWLPDPDADPDGRYRYRAEDVVRALCRLDDIAT